MSYHILTVFILAPFVLRLPKGKRTFRQYLDDIGLSRMQPFIRLVLFALSCYVILALSQAAAKRRGAAVGLWGEAVDAVQPNLHGEQRAAPRPPRLVNPRDLEIFRLHTVEKKTIRELANRYDISMKRVWGICTRMRKCGIN